MKFAELYRALLRLRAGFKCIWRENSTKDIKRSESSSKSSKRSRGEGTIRGAVAAHHECLDQGQERGQEESVRLKKSSPLSVEITFITAPIDGVKEQTCRSSELSPIRAGSSFQILSSK